MTAAGDHPMASSVDDVYAELTPAERRALLVYRLTIGRPVTTAEAALLLGLTKTAAYRYLCAVSRVVPIVCDDGKWQRMRV